MVGLDKSQLGGGTDSPQWFEPCLHSAYLNISSKNLLGQHRAIAGPPRLLPVTEFLPLLELIKADERPEGGIEMGLAFPLAAHGLVGLAATSSTSLWEAMTIIARYSPVRNTMFDYRCFREGDTAVLELRPRLRLGAFAQFFGYATILTFYNMFDAALEEAVVEAARFTLPWELPSVRPEFLDAKAAWDFGRPYLGMRISLDVAMRRAQNSEPDVCERLKRALDEELTRAAGTTAARVREILRRSSPEWPSLQTVANGIGMSKRTLARKLEAEKLNFQTLIDEARFELACWYLSRPDMRMAEIAERLGFSDQAVFTRSFRRVHGLSPSRYRSDRRHFLASLSSAFMEGVARPSR